MQQDLIKNIDAKGVFYRELNDQILETALNGIRRIAIKNVYGQRYIASRLYSIPSVEIEIFGTPGNDLAAFNDGHRLIVYGNAQDAVGNTMNDGEIVIHGHAGDILGMSARGGRIFVRDYVGYRAALHMKRYENKEPILVIGDTAQDFLGEYMAGGIVILLGLGLENGHSHKPNFVGTGMHGGVIYIRGSINSNQLGREVGIVDLDEKDYHILEENIKRYAFYFNREAKDILSSDFIKLIPVSKRPYGNLYVY
jgi:glutamate synthase domain-containing protein 3